MRLTASGRSDLADRHGVPLGNMSYGVTNGLSITRAILSENIASVELVRGTSDPRWGLHAIAGSANVRTRTGGTYLDARGIAGAFGTRDAQLSAGVESGRLSQNYLFAYRRTGGYRDRGGEWSGDGEDVDVGGDGRAGEEPADQREGRPVVRLQRAGCSGGRPFARSARADSRW